MQNKKGNLKVLIPYLVVFFGILPSAAQLKITDPELKMVSLRPYSELLAAGQTEYRANVILDAGSELPFIPLYSSEENLGFTYDNYWIRFNIENRTEQRLDYYLETARPITDEVELYLRDSSGKVTVQYSGDGIPFSDKTVAHRKSVFSLELHPNEKIQMAIHLKSDGESLQIPLRLIAEPMFLNETYKNQLFYGLFYGILILACIIYLFFYFAMRDATFLYYGIYVFFIAMLQFSLDGLFHQYILTDAGYISQRAVLASGLISIIFLTTYVRRFLNIDACNRFLLLSFEAMVITSSAALIALFFIPSFLVYCYPLTNSLGLMMFLLILVSIIYLKIKKIQIDPFFVSGIGFLIFCVTGFILNNLHIIPNSFVIVNATKFGVGLEIIFLSLSMGNRIRNLRRSNDEIQREALDQAENMNAMKSSFISNISHELRTPLNAIMGVAKSLSENSSRENLKENCELILSSSESLLGNIEDILDFTVIEKGDHQVDIQSFDIGFVLRHVKRINAEKAMAKNLAFAITVQEGMPNKLIGDKVKLVQILNNLLDNSIKFTPSGGVTLHVGYIKKDDSVTFTFTISDTGIGIVEEKMNTIFEAFTKKSFLDKREYYGLGLGLYIVKSYVDLQQGNISLQNKKGRGTVCRVQLDYQMDRTEMETDSIRNLNSGEPNLEGLKILLVEDNAFNQKVISLLFKKHDNIQLTIASNGAEALGIIRKVSFDLILMDLQMPIMDGFETTATIRSGQIGEHVAEIPIIVITADSTEMTRKEIFRLGADDYMTKPLNGRLLFEKIQKILVNVREY